MAQITKQILSASTDGRMIKVAATATLGTTIHTADASALDEVYVWAVNTSVSAVLLTVEYGGGAAPDNTISLIIPATDGLYAVVPGLILTNGLVVTAFAASANVINLAGFVNRIT